MSYTKRVSFAGSLPESSRSIIFTIWSIIFILRFHIKIGRDSRGDWTRGLM